MSNFERDKAWADRYFPEIERVIRQVAGQIISVRFASDDEDMKKATDYVVTVESGEIACRIRRFKPEWKPVDITIRAWRASGTETELAKLKRGFGRWMLYAWAKDDGQFESWVFIDLDKLRSSNLLDSDNTIANRDGQSGFLPVTLEALKRAGCVVQFS